MRYIEEVIIVEGRYDKSTVASAVGGTIIETSGFGIFNDREKLSLIRKLAERRGLIIFTDSDRAGFFIRGRLNGLVRDSSVNVKHAYIPDIKGREGRKHTSSKEGKLGVEGMSSEVIIAALERAGATFIDTPGNKALAPRITKADLYEAGLYGGQSSAINRRDFLRKLGLPERLSSTGLLNAMNIIYTRDEFLEMVKNNREVSQ